MQSDLSPGRPRRFAPIVPALAAALLGVLLVTVPRIGPEAVPTLPLPSVEPGATTLLAVGDIGSCDGTHDDAVAALAARLPGTIALLGDIAYPDGSPTDFADCFDPAWGPLRTRIRPAAGNHDYGTRDASGYFAYFGDSAGTPGEGWYSYQLGDWHVVVLNSNCDAVGGCGAGSRQLGWLERDLAAAGASRPGVCTLAYWHHARFSSGRHGNDTVTDPLWRALASAGADLVLFGHDHDYERFAPIDDMRLFVVGTGGRSLYEMVGSPDAASELRANTSYGLLMLTLRAHDFEWRFVPAAGTSFVDTGSATCR